MQTHLVLVLSVLLPGIMAALYGVIVGSAAYRDDPQRRPVALFSYALSIWILSSLPLVVSSSTKYANIFFIVQQFATYLAAISFYNVASTLSIDLQKKRRNTEIKIIAVLTVIWTIITIAFPSVNSVETDPSWQIPTFGLNSFTYGLYLILPVMIVGYSLLIMARSKVLDKKVKKSIGRESAFLVIAMLFSSYVMPIYVVDNLFLEYCSVGIWLVIFLVLFGRTALRSRVVDLRQNSWRTFISVAVKGLVLIAVFLVALLAVEIFYPDGKDISRTDLLIILPVYVVISSVLTSASGKFVANYLSRYQVDVLKLSQTVQRISYTKGVDIYSEGFLDLLAGSIGTESLVLVILEAKTEHEYSYSWGSGVSGVFSGKKNENSEVIKKIKELLKSIRDSGSSVIKRNLLVDKNLDDYISAIVLKSRELEVALLIGPRSDGTEYSDSDLSIVSTVTNEFSLTLENALQFDQIKTFNITLQDKVDEATRNLRKANEKLKALDQTKDDFISMASHQLRTPLTSVKGYVSMVLEGDAGKVSSKQKELLDQAFVSSQRMVYLIADLLNVSRLRTGKFIIEAKPTNLADVIEGEIKQLTETAKGRGLELKYDKPKNFPELMLDDTKIRQVIMNFADNAIYYTPSGGHVTVAVEDKGETIEFTVKDDGLGVPKSEQHHLFNKFYRASNAKKARPDGTGLGLFMAKKVIVAQGGAIIFKTEEGKGSTFGFSFAKKPLLPEHFKGAVAKEANTQK